MGRLHSYFFINLSFLLFLGGGGGVLDPNYATYSLILF